MTTPASRGSALGGAAPGFRGWLLAAVASLSASTGCSGGSSRAPRDDAGAGDGRPDGQDQAAYLNTLASAEELASLAAPQGRGVKYLAPREGAEPLLPLTAPCYFQNMNRYSWHLQFLNSFPELAGVSHDVYTRVVLGASSRRLWGGAVTPWDAVTHPGSGVAGIIAYTIYGDVGSVGAAEIAEVDGVLKGCMPFARTQLVFVPETADQRAVLSSERAALTARGVAWLFPEDLIPGVTHVAYSIGEGYGTLNVVPRGQSLATYGPRDVVVVESVPNDISIVAGLISRNPQNELGHVNLRLGERHAPNVAVPEIYTDSRVGALNGLLVHLRVTRDSFTLEGATLADAEAFWQAHQPHVPPPRADLAVTELKAFEELRAADSLAFGAKTANLGELARVLDRANRAAGFGIPFAHYQAFLRATGLDAVVATLLMDPRLRTDATYKRARLKALRDQIKETPFPATLLTTLQAQIAVVFGPSGARIRLRFRSSTNVEDLDTFSGAGLYDSRSGCLADDLDGDAAGSSLCLEPPERAVLEATLTARRQELAQHPDRVWLVPLIDDLTEDLADEKPVALAVKKVWASLWNERAFDQRDFYGIDHRLAYMGIAVNPTFIIEGASAVAVSNLQPDAGAPLYRLNSQVGSESVVQPEDPTAVAELLSFRRAGDPPQATEIQVHVASNRLPAGTPVWPPARLAELGRLLFRVHDHFAAHVYPQLSPLHLDCELKVTAAGDIVFKQARPFVSSEP